MKKRICGLLDCWMGEMIHQPPASIRQAMNPSIHKSINPSHP